LTTEKRGPVVVEVSKASRDIDGVDLHVLEPGSFKKVRQRAGLADRESAAFVAILVLGFERDRSIPEIPHEFHLSSVIPDVPRNHTVQAGDTLFGIAAIYGLNPETVLWANYDALQDNPHFLKPDMVLNIPPVNGIVYTVKGGDTVQSIAEKYKATADAIYTDGYEWNQLKSGQQPQVGASIIIPGGSREFKSWSVTQVASVGSSASARGNQTNSGFCPSAGGGLVGTGTFIWPADKHWLSGTPFTSWHTGIDLAADFGAPIYAADNGVVIYAGWNTWGYGNLVVIDHGNGWQTYYAHNSAIYVGCGQNVFQGNIVAAAGSTGRSTGPHLHFETRFQGTFPNPFTVLPPP